MGSCGSCLGRPGRQVGSTEATPLPVVARAYLKFTTKIRRVFVTSQNLISVHVYKALREIYEFIQSYKVLQLLP